MKEKSNSLGIIGFILSILSLWSFQYVNFDSWIFLPFILSILAINLSNKQRKVHTTKLAVAGRIIGIICLAFATMGVVGFIWSIIRISLIGAIIYLY